MKGKYYAAMLATHDPKPPRKRRTPWGHKLAVVREIASLGLTAKQTAILVGRSHALMWKMSKDGGFAFNTKESAFRRAVRAGYAAKKSPKQIAGELGRSVACVKVTASKMGLTGGNRSDPGKFVRGFEIPDELLDDYHHLTANKGFKAREAGAILGLVARPGDPRYSGQDQEAPRP